MTRSQVGRMLIAALLTLAAAAPDGTDRQRALAAANDGSTVNGLRVEEIPPPRRPAGRERAQGDPFEVLSGEGLLETLEQLTSIRPHRGWRHSTSAGEAEAFDLIQNGLNDLGFLAGRGLEIWRQPFHTFTGVEFHQTTVTVERGGDRFEAPADGSPGDRDWIDLALRVDSDGVLNDRDPDPVVASGAPLVVRSANEIYGLDPDQAAGRVVLLDYAVVDRILVNSSETVNRASALLEKSPAAIVMVTRYSNRPGESHGTFAGDLPAFNAVEAGTDIPVLSLRIEDLEPFGVRNWSDLSSLDRVEVTWDVDLLAPGDSQYLAARIPGHDASRAIILGAHLDSPNTPGALDDGSGSAALLEVARAIDRAWVIPDVDLVLVWFGSHERGLYGSYNFTAHSSELLDRTIAMLQMDCLGHPLEGVTNEIWLESWSYAAHGDSSIRWPSYLHDLAADRGVATRIADLHYLVSDNSSFSAFGVPNANMIFMNPLEPFEVHYANHLHDPYDDIDLAGLESVAFEDMAEIMLAAALYTAADDPWLRVTPPPDKRALFVGSHTEGIHMSPAGFTELGMTLTWEGFDVDMLPYGEPVTDGELADADLVVLLPVHDYPTSLGDVSLYDESWRTAEVDALERYVENGGALVLTTSHHRLKYLNRPYDENEDWMDPNRVGSRFGISYGPQILPGAVAVTQGNHPLVDGIFVIRGVIHNGHAVRATVGEIAATVGGHAAVVVAEHGSGTVVALGDVGMLGAGTQDPPANLEFWRNLADLAR